MAILLVVTAHSGIPVVAYGGSVGVTAFFVLSGYLITGLCLSERATCGRVSLVAFYRRRAFRLLPALSLMVLLSIPIAWAYGWSPGQVAAAGLAPLLYVANFVRAVPARIDPFDVTWSLSVEEQFYLVWPPLLLGVLRANPSRRGLAVTVTAAALLASGWHLAASAVMGVAWGYFMPDANAFALLIGCALACWSHEGTAQRGMVLLPLAMLVLLASLPRLYGPATDGPAVPAVQLAAALLTVPLIMGLVTTSPAWLSRGPIHYVGVVSYAWYLWHYTLITIGVLPWVADPWRDPVTSLLALGVAALSWRLVERPILQWSKGRRAGISTAHPGRPPVASGLDAAMGAHAR